MKIKIRLDRKLINVDVNDKTCRKLKCFHPGRHTHRGGSGMSGCSSETAKEYSCLTRDNKGCPDIVINKKED